MCNHTMQSPLCDFYYTITITPPLYIPILLSPSSHCSYSPDYLFTILHVSAHPYPPVFHLFSSCYSNHTSTQPPLQQCCTSPSHYLTFTPSSCLHNSGPAAVLSLYSCHRLDLYGCIINHWCYATLLFIHIQSSLLHCQTLHHCHH